MKVLLVDDHAIVRAGLRRLIADALPGATVCEAGSGREALALVRSERPDFAVLDLNLPGLGGLELLRRVRHDHAATCVLVLSMHDEALYATRALRAGAAGYVSKSAPPGELAEAIRRVAGGGRYVEAAIAQELALQAASGAGPLEQLTGRDIEIVRLLGEGEGLAEIADALGVSYKTVANGCTQIKAKLGVTRTADLIRLAVEMGLA